MPAQGDQHKSEGALAANPFEEKQRHMSEYTAKEIATLQARLNKRLGPEFISTRPGPGNQKIAYLSAEKAINLANEVFGFNGWSSSIQNIQIDFVDDNPTTGKVSIGLSVVIRITLRDGTYHEDIGYGGIENCKGKAMAFEKSKKEATTDALKRALRNFGNVLGNCIYDKDFVTKVSKVKAGPARFEVNDLYRHADFVPKSEDLAKPPPPQVPTLRHDISNTSRSEFEDSFDIADFDDVDFDESTTGRPEEVVLPSDSNVQMVTGPRSGLNSMITPSKAPMGRPQGGMRVQSNVGPRTDPPPRTGQLPNHTSAGLPINTHENCFDTSHSSSPGVSSQHFTSNPAGAPGAPPSGPISSIRPAGFYSARAAQAVDENNVPTVPVEVAKFNPHAESPSIRKTAGVDHNKSIPVKRDLLRTDGAESPKETNDARPEALRRTSTMGQGASISGFRGGMSTSAYRPPMRNNSPAIPNGVHGAITPGTGDRGLTAAKRQPLNDLSNVQQHHVTATTGDGADAKRQKVSGSDGDGLMAAPNAGRMGPT